MDDIHRVESYRPESVISTHQVLELGSSTTTTTNPPQAVVSSLTQFPNADLIDSLAIINLSQVCLPFFVLVFYVSGERKVELLAFLFFYMYSFVVVSLLPVMKILYKYPLL